MIICIVTENGFGTHDLGVDVLLFPQEDRSILMDIGYLVFGKAKFFTGFQYLVLFKYETYFKQRYPGFI